MERRIIAFRQDDAREWVAELECGHERHIRHDPPWEKRPWVNDATQREARVGSLVECGRCARDTRP